LLPNELTINRGFSRYTIIRDIGTTIVAVTRVDYTITSCVSVGIKLLAYGAPESRRSLAMYGNLISDNCSCRLGTTDVGLWRHTHVELGCTSSGKRINSRKGRARGWEMLGRIYLPTCRRSPR